MDGQTHVRPRVGDVPGWVEYDAPAAAGETPARLRKEFPAIGGKDARKFHMAMTRAGRNPRLVRREN